MTVEFLRTWPWCTLSWRGKALACIMTKGISLGYLAGWKHIRGFTQGRRLTVNLKAAASTSPHSVIWGSTFEPIQEKSHFGGSCCFLFITDWVSGGVLRYSSIFQNGKEIPFASSLGSVCSPQDSCERLQTEGGVMGSMSVPACPVGGGFSASFFPLTFTKRWLKLSHQY